MMPFTTSNVNSFQYIIIKYNEAQKSYARYWPAGKYTQGGFNKLIEIKLKVINKVTNFPQESYADVLKASSRVPSQLRKPA